MYASYKKFSAQYSVSQPLWHSSTQIAVSLKGWLWALDYLWPEFNRLSKYEQVNIWPNKRTRSNWKFIRLTANSGELLSQGYRTRVKPRIRMDSLFSLYQRVRNQKLDQRVGDNRHCKCSPVIVNPCRVPLDNFVHQVLLKLCSLIFVVSGQNLAKRARFGWNSH